MADMFDTFYDFEQISLLMDVTGMQSCINWFWLWFRVGI